LETLVCGALKVYYSEYRTLAGGFPVALICPILTMPKTLNIVGDESRRSGAGLNCDVDDTKSRRLSGRRFRPNGYITLCQVRRPQWPLFRKADVAADMTSRPFLTRSGLVATKEAAAQHGPLFE
jgi:hypothetical protein